MLVSGEIYCFVFKYVLLKNTLTVCRTVRVGWEVFRLIVSGTRKKNCFKKQKNCKIFHWRLKLYWCFLTPVSKECKFFESYFFLTNLKLNDFLIFIFIWVLCCDFKWKFLLTNVLFLLSLIFFIPNNARNLG